MNCRLTDSDTFDQVLSWAINEKLLTFTPGGIDNLGSIALTVAGYEQSRSNEGPGARITHSRPQYDVMEALIPQIQEERAGDRFPEALAQRLDDLIARMNRPEAAHAPDSVLFGDPAALNRTYQPGATETAK